MVLAIPEPNEKQKLFLRDTHKYIAYGGSRGGGKSWAVRVKAILLALNYAGIIVMIVRRSYPELVANHIKPMRKMLPNEMYRYNDVRKAEQDVARWMAEAKEAQAMFPGLDLNAEIQNPQFARLLQSGIDVSTAYFAVHNKELVPQAMQYDMRLIDMAEANLVHDQFGQKRPIPAGSGKTIEFRKFAPLVKALTPLTEGVTPDGSNLSVTAITAQVAQYGDYILQSDVLELTALDNTILEATKLLGSQAGRTLDSITRDVINAGTNVTFASKWSGTTETEVEMRSELDATAVLKVDTINQVVAKLKAVNAPTIGGKYVTRMTRICRRSCLSKSLTTRSFTLRGSNHK